MVFHGLKFFNYMPFFSRDWEEKKIKEFMENEKSNRNTLE